MRGVASGVISPRNTSSQAGVAPSGTCATDTPTVSGKLSRSITSGGIGVSAPSWPSAEGSMIDGASDGFAPLSATDCENVWFSVAA